MNRLSIALVTLALFATAACGKDAPAPSTPSAAAGAARFTLAADPGGGLGVAEARKAAPKDDVVVVGRVREITPGLLAFTLIDTSLKHCAQNEMEACPTPWDYCCTPEEEVASHSVGVTANENGDVVLGKIPELRNLDLVAVKGKLVKEKGEVFLHATGWYRRERPTLSETIKFPQ